MLKAHGFKFTTRGESADNHCRVGFPATTHVIRIMFNGGMTKDGIHPLLPNDTSYFTVLMKRGKTLLWNNFIGLADLGSDESWKTTPEVYPTDGDNFLDLCLQLGADDNFADITSVLIQANSVFPPRGTGPNVQHQVKVDQLPEDQYPYSRNIETAADKIFDIHF